MQSYTPFELFKPIRNQFRKFYYLEIVKITANKIHEIEFKNLTEWKGWLPWHLMNIIKWGYQFGDQYITQKKFSENELASLMNKIMEFEGKCGSPFLDDQNQKSAIKFFRTKAYQQFWIQKRIGTWDIARQHLLFCDLPDDHLIKILFLKEKKITIEQFIELSLVLWSWLAMNYLNIIFIKEPLFQNLNISEFDIDSYCSILSLKQTEVKKYLENNSKTVSNPCFQLNEPSPFIQKPLLELSDSFLVYSRKLFERTINELIYDQIKSIGGSKASELFSKRIEEYINDALTDLKIPFLDEKQLKQLVPSSKVPDFLINLKDCTIILESKAIGIRPSVQVFPANDQLKNELEDSVIKAVIQGFTFISSLEKKKQKSININTFPPFLLILTYKDLFLGNGQMIWNEFLFSSIKSELEKQNIDLKLIPPDHIVVLSIEEFDILMSILYGKQEMLKEILLNMVQENSNPTTEKFSFLQHLVPFIDKDAKLPYLDIRFDELSARVQSKFKK